MMKKTKALPKIEKHGRREGPMYWIHSYGPTKKEIRDLQIWHAKMHKQNQRWHEHQHEKACVWRQEQAKRQLEWQEQQEAINRRWRWIINIGLTVFAIVVGIIMMLVLF